MYVWVVWAKTLSFAGERGVMERVWLLSARTARSKPGQGKGKGFLDLGLKIPNAHMNLPVSQRNKPNSSPVLIDEQSNPSYLLQHEDTGRDLLREVFG
jgi:hypothetical protein